VIRTLLADPARATAAALAALGVLVLHFYWPLVASPAGQVIDAPDYTRYFVWLHQYAKETVASGHLPLWNPHGFAGTPFAANPSLMLFYPPIWIGLLMPIVDMHRVVVVGHALLAGLLLYLYLRQVGRSRGAAAFACLPWVFGSYFMANAVVGHLPRIFTMAWLPLVLYFYERSARGARLRNLLMAGFALGVQILAGEPQNSLYTAILFVVYAAVRSFGEEPPPLAARRWLLDTGLLAAAAVLTSAVQLLPTVELLGLSERGANTYEFVTTLSFPPRSLAGFVVPWSTSMPWLVDAATGRAFVVLNWEFAGYAGILTLVLAGVSWAVRGQPALRAARVVLVLGLVLMLGRYTPVYELLFRWLPGVSAFRIPARAVLLVQWSLVVMGAFGWDWLFGGESPRWRGGWWRWAAPALLALGGLLVACVLAADLSRPVGDLYMRVSAVEPVRLSSPVVVGPLGCILAALIAVVTLRWLPATPARMALLALLIADLRLARPAVPLAPFGAESDPSRLLFQDLQDRGGAAPFRVDLAASHAHAAAAMGVAEDVNAYWPLSVARFHNYVYAMRRRPAPAHRRHELHESLYTQDDPFPVRLLNVQFASKIDPRAGTTTVVRDPTFLPRAWLVPRTNVVAGPAEALAAVRSPGFDPRATVVLEGRAGRELSDAGGPSGTVTGVRRRPEGGLELTVQAPRDTYLVLSEVRYPGWRATVDGQEVPVEAANYVLSAVPLQAGARRISYRYDPWTVRVGALLSLLSLAAAGLMATGALGGALLRPGRR
jgi:hypothetical protein